MMSRVMTSGALRQAVAVCGALAIIVGCEARSQTTSTDPDPIVLEDGSGLPEIEIDRVSDELRDVVRPDRRADPDSTDSALVFNNPRRHVTWVYCVAYNGAGAAIGRARLRIPGNGVRFVFASDMAAGQDFVGSATCAARSRVVPSLFIVGGGLTDAKALVNHGWDQTRIRFPVVAAF